MEFLAGLDRSAFSLINTVLHNPAFDVIMPFITNKWNTLPFLLLAGLVIFLRDGIRGRKAVFMVLISVLISDQLANILKEIFHRIRPCNELEGVRLLVGCSDSFSLPSNHAANSFAGAIVMSLCYVRLWPVFSFIALLVAYSRVYVGVHYPFDVIAGAALGFLSGFMIVYIFKKIFKDRPKTSPKVN